jgi:hypothetical protein
MYPRTVRDRWVRTHAFSALKLGSRETLAGDPNFKSAQTVIQPDQLMSFGCKDKCDINWEVLGGALRRSSSWVSWHQQCRGVYASRFRTMTCSPSRLLPTPDASGRSLRHEALRLYR